MHLHLQVPQAMHNMWLTYVPTLSLLRTNLMLNHVISNDRANSINSKQLSLFIFFSASEEPLTLVVLAE